MRIARESHMKAIRAGVKFAFGTDTGLPKEIAHGENAKEVAALVRLGMTPINAIRTATINAAELLGTPDRGELKIGILADIIAVDGNPLEEIALLEKVSFVVKGGKVYPTKWVLNRTTCLSEYLNGLLNQEQLSILDIFQHSLMYSSVKIGVKKNKQSSFYFFIGIVGILAILIGFFTTYITPSLKGSFNAPTVVHIHGAFAFGWVLLFFVQTLTVKYRSFNLHKTLGYSGLFIAVGIIATMLPTGLFQVRRDVALGMGETAISQIVGIVTTLLLFAILVGAGYAYRKKPKIHKRLLLLATIVLLWPAWFRFRHYFPSVPRPDIWFGVVLADSLIIIAWVVDKLTYNKIHPVLLYGGVLIMTEHAIEVLTFDSGPWRKVGKIIYEALV